MITKTMEIPETKEEKVEWLKKRWKKILTFAGAFVLGFAADETARALIAHRKDRVEQIDPVTDVPFLPNEEESNTIVADKPEEKIEDWNETNEEDDAE